VGLPDDEAGEDGEEAQEGEGPAGEFGSECGVLRAGFSGAADVVAAEGNEEDAGEDEDGGGEAHQPLRYHAVLHWGHAEA
jgi:hypothetical protein